MTITHLVTAEELYQMGSDAPYELIEGVLYEVSPSSMKSSAIAVRIGSALLTYVDAHQLGFVTGADGGYTLSHHPATVVAPDVGFVRQSRCRVGIPEKGFCPIPPDLAVEVISPTDPRADIRRKQALYTQAGVPLVWWVEPEARTVTVYRPNQEPQVLSESATLDGGEVLPGFSLEISTIFHG
jgi:Uma2 family endonuclease